jgi:hypothetical protein
VVGITTGSRGKVPGKTCEERIRNNNNKLRSCLHQNEILVASIMSGTGIFIEDTSAK